MSPLHMIELTPDLPALLRFLHGQGLEDRGDEDLSYGVHAWLRAAFGERAPKPFRLLAKRGRPTRILGYTSSDAAGLADRMRDFAEPLVHAVCPPGAIVSKEMPTFEAGRRVAFELLCCPVARKARSGIEKDLFLVHVDRSPLGAALDRSAIYCDWVKERFGGAASVADISLAGFRRIHQARRAQATASPRRLARLERPHALIRGECIVEDGEKFGRDILAKGVGRHRAFGYGMLLLRPPR